MYSCEDIERFYFQHKTEALPLGMSIETFCLKNKVRTTFFQMVKEYTKEDCGSASRRLLTYLIENTGKVSS